MPTRFKALHSLEDRMFFIRFHIGNSFSVTRTGGVTEYIPHRVESSWQGHA